MIPTPTRALRAGLLLACLALPVAATETLDDDAPPPATEQASAALSEETPPEPAQPGADVADPAFDAAPEPAESRTAPADAAPVTHHDGSSAGHNHGFPTVEPVPPFELLGSTVIPGETGKLSWFSDQHYSGVSSPAQVLVAHGSRPGQVLCVVAAVHGDEINGVEIARRVFHRTDPTQLAGTLVVVPITNLHGFERGYRYLADRRDLNRHFPGSAAGSLASRIAHSFFHNVVRRCDTVVDLHTGSFHRTNLPQLRADLGNPAVVHLTHGFGATAVVDDDGTPGTLRRAANNAGIAAVTLEIGEPMRLQTSEVRHGAKAVRSLMAHLGMVRKSWRWRDPQPVYYDSAWVRSARGGILLSSVKLGDTVSAGQVLGVVMDPISNARGEVVAPHVGRIIGMAVNQVVRPGYAVFHIGKQRSEEELTGAGTTPATADESPTPHDGPQPAPPEDAPHGVPAEEPRPDE